MTRLFKKINSINISSVLFEKKEGFIALERVTSFLIGVIFTICLSATAIANVTENTVQVVEKPVVEKVPVYMKATDQQQIRCMAENTYFEAGFEPHRGKIAVNNVVMNRVADSRFPKTPCAVIAQRSGRVCQFSWKCERGKRIVDLEAYNEAKKVAEQVYLGNVADVTGGAQFYHANYVRPSWSRVFDRTARIGAHIFYRG